MYTSSYGMQIASTLIFEIQNKNIKPLNLCRFGGKIIWASPVIIIARFIVMLLPNF